MLSNDLKSIKYICDECVKAAKELSGNHEENISFSNVPDYIKADNNSWWSQYFEPGPVKEENGVMYQTLKCVFDIADEHVIIAYPYADKEKEYALKLKCNDANTVITYYDCSSSWITGTSTSARTSISYTTGPEIEEFELTLATKGFLCPISYAVTDIEVYDYDKCFKNGKGIVFKNLYYPNSIKEFKFSDTLEYAFNTLYVSDLSNLELDLSNVTSLRFMFQGSKVNKFPKMFNAHNINNCISMFSYITSGTITKENIDLSFLSECKTCNLNSLFAYSTALRSIDLSALTNIDSTFTMSQMFANCTYLNEFISPVVKVTGESFVLTDSMFQNCTNLKTVKISISRISGYMLFNACSYLEEVDLSDVEYIGKPGNMFNNCKNLKLVDFCHSDMDVAYAKSTPIFNGVTYENLTVKCTQELKDKFYTVYSGVKQGSVLVTDNLDKINWIIYE